MTSMNESRLLSVKMRASARGEHVSGAERIVPAAAAPRVAAALVARALSHSKGEPDFVNLKLEEPGEIMRLEALRVSTCVTATAEEGRRAAADILRGAGVGRVDEIMALFSETHSMRGAMLLDADTLERLEPDRERGVRATRMDAAPCAVGAFSAASAAKKNHFAEAVVLATKVANAPGIVGEICVSDDPDYVTGYVATREIGYRRITTVKEMGDPHGGRIFLYRGPRSGVEETIRFLERQSVVVDGVPGSPPPAAPALDAASALADELAAIDAAGLRRACRVLHSPAGPVAAVGEGAEMREVVVMSSNDYLDLANDSRVKSAAAAALERWGAGSGGSRRTTGTQDPHRELERRIAAFKGEEAAVLYATGYMANVGVLTALAGKGGVILSDELNHASIIDGARLSGAAVVVYRHADMDDLAAKLSSCGGFARRLVVSDGVFSMDGDILDLPRFVSVCRAHGALSVVDEAHATGVVGATGRGLRELFGCDAPDVTVGTLSKALGAEGGFAATSRLVADYLVNKSRPFIFSTAPMAASAAAALAALDVLEAEPWRVARLRGNMEFFVGECAKAGVDVRNGGSAIAPVVVGDESRAARISEALLAKGFLVPAIRYPSVAKGAARLRVALMCSHTREQLSAAAKAIGEGIAFF